MIKPVGSYADCREFAESFQADTDVSDPMLSTEEQIRCNLEKAFTRPNRQILGVYQDGQLAGLFVLLVLDEDKYLEMLVGLSREAQAYRELMEYLARNYPGWEADFVFNPRNGLLKATLEDVRAEFEQEQQKMVFSGSVIPGDSTGIQEFSEQYAAEYYVIHSRDVYWTGEKVAAAPERFRIFLAIDGGRVVGYMDVTHCFEENEPYNLFVLPEYRRRGFGRKLLAAALECNRPKGMMLLVDTDNVPVIRLYASMGFQTVRGQNSLTAHWKIGADRSLKLQGRCGHRPLGKYFHAEQYIRVGGASARIYRNSRLTFEKELANLEENL